MSRTGLINGLTPRRSKRLLTNGYYQQTSDEESVADTSENESIVPNAEDRRLHYGESPTKKVFRRFKHRPRNKNSNSPDVKTAYLNRTAATGRQTRTRRIEVEVSNQNEADHEQQHHNIVNVASTSTLRLRQEPDVRSQPIPRSRPVQNFLAAGEGMQEMSKTKSTLLHNYASATSSINSTTTENRPQSNHNLEKNVLDGMIFEKHRRQSQHLSRNETVIQQNNRHYSNVNQSASFSDNEESFISSESDNRNALFKRSVVQVSFLSKVQRFIYCNILYKLFKFMTWLVTIDAWLLSRRYRYKGWNLVMKILYALAFLSLVSLVCYWLLAEEESSFTGITSALKYISSAIITLPTTALDLAALSRSTIAGVKTTSETPKLISQSSDDEFEKAYLRIQLMLAEQIAKVNMKIEDMHVKITSETEARILLERKLAAENENVYREKTKEFETRMQHERQLVTQAKQQFITDIEKLQNELLLLRSNMTSDSVRSKAEFNELHKLLASSFDSKNKLVDFNSRLTALDARINNLHGTLMKVMSDFDAHIGNTTYISNIAKVQFVQSFLELLQNNRNNADMTEGQQNLHYLFLAWLNNQGFVKMEKIHEQHAALTMNVSDNTKDVEARIMKEIEKLQTLMKTQSDKLTLNTLVTENKHTTITTSDITKKLVKQIISDELALYSADRTGKADFALESVGGTIVNTRCSESYIHSRAVFSIMGIPLHYKVQSPRTILQPSTMPGDCWAFKGTSGFVVIKLSQPIIPTSFSLEHIPRQLSPDGKIESAPQDFSVFGLKDEHDPDGRLLGIYRYEEYGTPLQPFPTAEQNLQAFDFIELRVLSNWGNQVYTCLYRFRVHGNIPKTT